ncbi:MAG: hypothetical protein ACSLEL_03315 [Candidatus Malihini olakiniferum]
MKNIIKKRSWAVTGIWRSEKVAHIIIIQALTENRYLVDMVAGRSFVVLMGAIYATKLLECDNTLGS